MIELKNIICLFPMESQSWYYESSCNCAYGKYNVYLQFLKHWYKANYDEGKYQGRDCVLVLLTHECEYPM